VSFRAFWTLKCLFCKASFVLYSIIKFKCVCNRSGGAHAPTAPPGYAHAAHNWRWRKKLRSNFKPVVKESREVEYSYIRLQPMKGAAVFICFLKFTHIRPFIRLMIVFFPVHQKRTNENAKTRLSHDWVYFYRATLWCGYRVSVLLSVCHKSMLYEDS